MDITFYVAKMKPLISCAVIALPQLNFAFVFAYAKAGFYDTVQIKARRVPREQSENNLNRF